MNAAETSLTGPLGCQAPMIRPITFWVLPPSFGLFSLWSISSVVGKWGWGVISEIFLRRRIKKEMNERVHFILVSFIIINLIIVESTQSEWANIMTILREYQHRTSWLLLYLNISLTYIQFLPKAAKVNCVPDWRYKQLAECMYLPGPINDTV